jgi:hypothetical protein
VPSVSRFNFHRLSVTDPRKYSTFVCSHPRLIVVVVLTSFSSSSSPHPRSHPPPPLLRHSVAENLPESETSDTNYSDDEVVLANKSPSRPSTRKRNRVMGKCLAGLNDEEVPVVSDIEENRSHPPKTSRPAPRPRRNAEAGPSSKR